MRDQHDARTTHTARGLALARKSEAEPRTQSRNLLALQNAVGNAAVVQMLRRAGFLWAQEQHQHGAECGHQQAEQSAVQRPSVQRAPAYEQTVPEGVGDEDAALRMLHRIGRTEHESGAYYTRHVAAAVTPDGMIGLAGNTGNLHVTSSDARRWDAQLNAAVDPEYPLPQAGRSRKDAIKLRALLDGSYIAQHGYDRKLIEIANALRRGRVWEMLNEGGKGSQHGELSLLEKLVRHWESHPNHTGRQIEIPLGGVKKPCGACAWALEATNLYFGLPLGYRVAHSSDHGSIYQGWIMPEYLRGNALAKQYIEIEAERIGGYFQQNSDGYLQLVTNGSLLSGVTQDNNESDSEWEEIR